MSQPELESSQGPRATVADIIAADQLAAKLANADLLSIEEYLRNSYEPDADYVDGVIEERCLGQWDHSAWQDAIGAWFRAHAKEWNVRVRPEMRVRTGPTRFRIPDITVVDRAQPVEQVPTLPPLSVWEVLSPEDRIAKVLQKLSDYAEMGIREIWLLDPETKIFSRFNNGQLTPATHHGQPGDRIYFRLSDIEAYLD